MLVAEYLHLDVWLLAHFSQNEELISALSHANGDPFRSIACAMDGVPNRESSKVNLKLPVSPCPTCVV